MKIETLVHYVICVANCVTLLKKLRDRRQKSTIREDEISSSLISEKDYGIVPRWSKHISKVPKMLVFTRNRRDCQG